MALADGAKQGPKPTLPLGPLCARQDHTSNGPPRGPGDAQEVTLTLAAQQSPVISKEIQKLPPSQKLSSLPSLAFGRKLPIL